MMVQGRNALEKELLFEQLWQVAQASDYIFFAKFKGISANEINELRRRLEKVADRAIFVKNTIARIVFERLNAKEASEFLEGSVLLTMGKRDPQVVSKVLVEFAKDKENFELKGVLIDRKTFQKPFIQELAKLPSRQELIGALVCRLKGPINGFVFGMGGIVRSFVSVLDQIQKKK